MFRVPEKHRVQIPGRPSYPGQLAGGFVFRYQGEVLRCIAAKGGGWEHVSVSLAHRVPTWAEMCIVKAVFWEPEDVVMQLHPAESEYVNDHPYVLHLWRPENQTVPVPPRIFV